MFKHSLLEDICFVMCFRGTYYGYANILISDIRHLHSSRSDKELASLMTINCCVLSDREFSKRMDMDLPFYYWTLNERFSDDVYPSFDERPEIDEEVDGRNHPLRLHRLRINQREDSSIFVVGRAHLPARHRQTIRQSFHRPGNYLAPPPNP